MSLTFILKAAPGNSQIGVESNIASNHLNIWIQNSRSGEAFPEIEKTFESVVCEILTDKQQEYH